MDNNPYQSPNPDQSLSSISQASDMTNVPIAGLWRDGTHLVLSPSESQFPLRCIKTNEPVASFTPHRIDWIEASLLTKILVGWMIAKSLWGRSTDVEFGLSEVFQQKRRRLIRIAWSLVIGGMAGLIVFTFVYVAVMLSGVQESTGDMLMFIPVVASFAAIGGIPVLVLAYAPILRVTKCKDDLLWLSGVTPEFLNALPQWTSE
ncbi:MAG TPA: hypothetical protein VE890_13925 [Thermoguttaceae bacterium]|nr:hypothetical protein [Thermoguttaceae bacterium]